MRAFIGLGSNFGNRVRNIRRAIELLQSSSGICLLRSASLYKTAPVGVENQRWFINTVVEVETELDPHELFRLCKEIEAKLGRQGRGRWGPREIDLDLLLFGDLVAEYDDLVIPHPRAHRRRFVLVPLAELDRELVHPRLGRSVEELLDRLNDEKRVIKLNERDLGKCSPSREEGCHFRKW